MPVFPAVLFAITVKCKTSRIISKTVMAHVLLSVYQTGKIGNDNMPLFGVSVSCIDMTEITLIYSYFG